MKKTIILGLVSFFFFFNSIAQNSNFTTNGKSVVIQNIDTVTYSDVTNINNRLTSYYQENRKSQLFIFGGTTVAILGTLLFQPSQDEINPFLIIGGISELIGGIIYLDSFKFLNINKKHRAKRKRAYFNDDIY
jgi:hypothetical protein